MHVAIARPARLSRLLLPTLLGAAALGACTDMQPIAPRQQGEPIPQGVVQAFDCIATTTGTGSVRCAPATPGTGQASGIIFGGQNQFVTLTASNLSYNAGTEIFEVDVTVQNLMNEAIGTPDGVTPDPEGIQVFFYDEPVAIGPPGEVSVYEPDGTAFFTSANQPYFAYPEILASNQVSSAHTWTFQVENTVTTFRFRVLIETDVQYLLVINEVMVNPNGTDDTGLEWFEVYNGGTRAVDLQNLVIADSAASGRRPYHMIGSSVNVPSGGYATLGQSTNTTLNGGATIDYSYGGALTLANSLDAVKISRVYGTDTVTIDRTQYSSPGISAQSGISRELKNPALDNSNMDGSNWDNALVTAVYGSGGRGTPKAQNSTYTP
ncbi:MAG TPA: lamin tail domain-containing protein [Longimicrobium sp.]|nr:lamin tail domain-containing protein [Longimicrobium sp.]